MDLRASIKAALAALSDQPDFSARAKQLHSTEMLDELKNMLIQGER